MTLFEIKADELVKVAETTFATEGIRERQDIQRLIRGNIGIIEPDLLVVAEEFGDWEESGRRLDLLCVDSDGTLVVIEIKRTDDGGHMELQAIRYAAMVSSMTFDQLASAHASYLGVDLPTAQAALISFLGSGDGEVTDLNKKVRIILLSANFSKEITTSVLWLNRQGLDIQCFRLKPLKHSGVILVDIQQIIPLPEAAEYETRLKAQRQETERVESARKEIFLRFWGQIIERSRGRTTIFENRTGSRDHWLGGRIGRRGFELNFVLTQLNSRVECYIRFGGAQAGKAKQAFNALEAQKPEIEAAFGGPLEWDSLPDRLGCRIACAVDGGWRLPEDEWPDLQDRLIDSMVRLERALKNPVMALKLDG